MDLLLKDKKVLIMGIANKWSIAWGIARSCADAGAELLFTYQGERTEDSVRALVQEIPGASLYPCDVTKDEEMDALFEAIEQEHGILHGLVHCLAFAKKEELMGHYYNTSRDGYLLAQNISAYSLAAVARRARPLMTEGGSLVTLTYLGGERAVANYNVMGVAKAALEASVKYLAVDLGPDNIRVNAISAGPIKTLAAQGIKGFSSFLKTYERKTPLRTLVDPAVVGDTALYLLSPLSRGVTGENIHVDGGYHVLGV